MSANALSQGIESITIDSMVGELRRLEEERQRRRGLTLIEASHLRDLHEAVLRKICTAPRPSERRESLRVPCDMRVVLVRGGDRLEGLARDFGAGGLFVDLRSELAIAEREGLLLAEMSLDAESRTHLGVRARVVHVTSSAGLTGVGLELEPRGYVERTRARALFFDLLRRVLEGTASRGCP